MERNIQFLSISNKFPSFIKFCFIKTVVQEKVHMDIYEETRMEFKFSECLNIVLTFTFTVPIFSNSMQLLSSTNIL